jgi:large subunit ribosomal protein L21
MYAVVSTGGKQLKVETGSEAVVEKLDAPIGETVKFDVLFVADGDTVMASPEAVASAVVTAEVLEHFKGDKQVVFKFKKRKGYKRLKGHRQDQTRVRITDIAVSGGSAKPAKKAAAKPEPKGVDAPVAEVKAPAAKAPVAEAQCEAIKADGQRCTKKAKEGSKYCGVHAKKYDE